MPRILSVSTFKPPHEVKQSQAVELTRGSIQEKFNDIERLLKSLSKRGYPNTESLYAS